jgi:hypothetical protein
MKKEGKDYIAVEVDPNDPTAYTYKGKLVARRVARRMAFSEVIDYRLPDYLPMSPCPYCDGLIDKHDPLKHINPKLGTPVKGTV